MEGIGSEVSHKIRAAIKAKLIELGAYIDDELPDYIMVMVANKRSKQQMDEDLQLFLGSNTKTFTAWLHTVLQKLQEVTIANFDAKKESQGKRCNKRKQSNTEDDSKKDAKSSEEKGKISKKHSKKHKEGKKLKKSKHKSKEKEKSKCLEKRQNKNEDPDNEKEKKTGKSEDEHLLNLASDVAENVEKLKDRDNVDEDDDDILNLDDSSGKAVFGISAKNDNLREEGKSYSSKSSSASHFSEDSSKRKNENEHEIHKNMEEKFPDTIILTDEFNIEPLEATKHEREFVTEGISSDAQENKSDLKVASGTSVGMTVKVPTRELLKEHDKILSETEENNSRERKKSDSEESLSPEEIRKQLLLSRAKKKLEQSKLADRMKSNSPEIQVIENSEECKQDRFSSDREMLRRRSSQRREYDEAAHITSSNRDTSERPKSNVPREVREISTSRFDTDIESYENKSRTKCEQKKNVISISKSLEMEKNLTLKDEEYSKSKNKAGSSQRKKPVSSRVVTIPEPEAPEIPSIVKVKPREYISKEMQANKVLILKAVADAEKSIATVPTRYESDVEPKKAEALFTKNLRGKRYEKLAVTLSNVPSGAFDRDKTKRMVSVDSENNNNALDRRTVSLQDSETSQGFKSRPELTLKNISNKSEDQFISSKTSAMEKNDKYIHCWLEGVEKAVKDDEIVNPSEIDDFISGNYSDEGKEYEDDVGIEEDKTRKRSMSDEEHVSREETSKSRKTCDKSSANTKLNEDDGPQIVVTLDGLSSKAIRDIILRNRETPNGPLLTAATSKKSEKGKDPKEVKYSDDTEKNSTSVYRNASTSRSINNECPDRVTGFEKISERFGRINKTSDLHEYKDKYYEFERERYEKKYLKYQGTDKEKHYEKLKDKYASAGESKNKKLIARLSEKFGKVDREFENKKRKYSDEDLRHSYSSRKVDKSLERDDKYRKFNRKSVRSTSDNSHRPNS